MAVTPDDMLLQLQALASDVRTLSGDVADEARAAVGAVCDRPLEQVVLVGAGDSFDASWAMQMAFETFSGLPCRALSSASFIDYYLPSIEERVTRRTLVIVTSASGKTPVAVEAAAEARSRGAMTVAITTSRASPLTATTGAAVSVDVLSGHRSPGIRTFQGSLLALLLLAIEVAESRGSVSSTEADDLRSETDALADAIEATTTVVADVSRQAVDAFEELERVMVLGSGPSLGVAKFAAAKLVEAGGCLAVGQELEEWSHVERFAYPMETPIFVIAPPGRSHTRCVRRAETARRANRHVVAVADADDTAFADIAAAVLPVRGRVREECSPFLYHLFGGYVAFNLASRLGRLPFQAGSDSAETPTND